jgi:hypothetical protein
MWKENAAFADKYCAENVNRSADFATAKNIFRVVQ